MIRNNINEEEFDEILHSLDGIKKAEAPEFFYTRLQASFQQRRSNSMLVLILGFLGQPAFALASLSMFVLINLYSLTSMKSVNNEEVTINATTSPSLQTFAEEYDLSISTLYNELKN